MQSFSSIPRYTTSCSKVLMWYKYLFFFFRGSLPRCEGTGSHRKVLCNPFRHDAHWDSERKRQSPILSPLQLALDSALPSSAHRACSLCQALVQWEEIKKCNQLPDKCNKPPSSSVMRRYPSNIFLCIRLPPAAPK